MAKFLGMPKVQYFDNNGDPLSGGKLYSYESGTTTLKATYPTIADASADTNANANPVVLDSRGEANVVLKGSTKLVLKDSDDNTIWTVDNISEVTTLVDANGNTALDVSAVASAVNYVVITNAATGNNPSIGVDGDNVNINLTLTAKGTGDVVIDGSSLIFDDAEGFKDDDGNFYLRFQQTASAVNYVDLTNAATGNNPIFEAVGTDSNIGIDFQTKGSGIFHFLGNSTQSAYLRFYEDADNGSNYIELQTPASLASSKTITIQDASGTLGVAASDAAIEAETDEDTFLRPNQVKQNPGVGKAWAYFINSTISDSNGVSSTSSGSTGNYTINFSTNFANTNYAVLAQAEDSSANPLSVVVDDTSRAVGSVNIQVRNASTGAAYAPSRMNVVVFGEQ